MSVVPRDTDVLIDGKKLKQLRVSTGKTQREVARSGASTKGNLSRIERAGPVFVQGETFTALAEAFSLSREMLLERVGINGEPVKPASSTESAEKIIAHLVEASRGTGKPLDRFVDYLLGLHERENKKALAADALKAGKRRSA